MKLPRPRAGEAIKAEHIRQLSDAIRSVQPISSSSILARQTPAGTALETITRGGGGGSGFSGAWAPTVSPDGDTVTLTAGSIHDGTNTWLPTVTDIELVPSALNYIYLRCQLNPTLEDFFVTGGTLSSATVFATDTPQVSGFTYGYILLCTVDLTDGGSITRYAWFNFACQLRNYGVGNIRFHYWIA